jgi:hypothetical protein
MRVYLVCSECVQSAHIDDAEMARSMLLQSRGASLGRTSRVAPTSPMPALGWAAPVLGIAYDSPTDEQHDPL